MRLSHPIETCTSTLNFLLFIMHELITDLIVCYNNMNICDTCCWYALWLHDNINITRAQKTHSITRERHRKPERNAQKQIGGNDGKNSRIAHHQEEQRTATVPKADQIATTSTTSEPIQNQRSTGCVTSASYNSEQKGTNQR